MRLPTRLLSLLLIALLFIGAFCLSACKEKCPDYDHICQRPFSAVLSGRWNGEDIKAKVIFSASESSSERDLCAEFLSGSLNGVILTRSDGNLKITIGGMKDIDFEEHDGGLSTLVKLLSPDRIISQCSLSGDGDARFCVSAETDGILYSIMLDRSGIPLEIRSAGGSDNDVSYRSFDLSVSCFSY